jgi:hypothetical protein
VKAEDDWHHGNARANSNDGSARAKLCESIRGSTRAALWHDAVVSTSGKDSARGGQVCLNTTRASPDWKEPAEPAQNPCSDATSTNNERPETEPPDARLRWRGNA